MQIILNVFFNDGQNHFKLELLASYCRAVEVSTSGGQFFLS